MHHSKTGYYRVMIHLGGRKNSQVKRPYIHKLVAEAWIGDKPDELEVDHIDRNTHNNDYKNLRYVNHSEQMKNRVLSKEIIEQAKRNCLEYTMRVNAKRIKIKNSEIELEFPSHAQAAAYLAEKTGKNKNTINWKFKQKRSNILGYDIIYLSECRD